MSPQMPTRPRAALVTLMILGLMLASSLPGHAASAADASSVTETTRTAMTTVLRWIDSLLEVLQPTAEESQTSSEEAGGDIEPNG